MGYMQKQQQYLPSVFCAAPLLITSSLKLRGRDPFSLVFFLLSSVKYPGKDSCVISLMDSALVN